jgi:hypothetical protein
VEAGKYFKMQSASYFWSFDERINRGNWSLNDKLLNDFHSQNHFRITKHYYKLLMNDIARTKNN